MPRNDNAKLQSLYESIYDPDQRTRTTNTPFEGKLADALSSKSFNTKYSSLYKQANEPERRKLEKVSSKAQQQNKALEQVRKAAEKAYEVASRAYRDYMMSPDHVIQEIEDRPLNKLKNYIDTIVDVDPDMNQTFRDYNINVHNDEFFNGSVNDLMTALKVVLHRVRLKTIA